MTRRALRLAAIILTTFALTLSIAGLVIEPKIVYIICAPINAFCLWYWLVDEV